MVPVAFEYHRAGSVAEALSLMAQHGEDAKIIAGGHSMVPAMKLAIQKRTAVKSAVYDTLSPRPRPTLCGLGLTTKE